MKAQLIRLRHWAPTEIKPLYPAIEKDFVESPPLLIRGIPTS
jgi:hypothetical protein